MLTIYWRIGDRKRMRCNVWWIVLLMAMKGYGWEPLPYTGSVVVEEPQQVFCESGQLRSVEGVLRVASYNLENYTDGNSDGRFRTADSLQKQTAGAASLIDEIDPDILILQEIENGPALSLLNQTLEKPFPCGYITRFENAHGQVNNLNIAVLSRHPVSEAAEIDFKTLGGPARPTRGLLRLVLQLDEETHLLLYGVHLKSNWGRDRSKNSAKRYHGLALLREDEQALFRQYPQRTWETMVVGDMNVDPAALSFQDDQSLQPLADMESVLLSLPEPLRITVPRRRGEPRYDHPSVTFDHLFVTEELRQKPWFVVSKGVLQKGVNTNDNRAYPGSDGQHISDHYPIYADVLKSRE